MQNELSAERSLLFIHIRKTGGGAFGDALQNRFAARDSLRTYELDLNQVPDIDRYRFLRGHFDIHILDRVEHRPFVVTCLRDPIERALSTFSYYRWFPVESYGILRAELGPAAYERRVEAMRLARECSLSEFLERAPDLAREHLGDVQARTLSGAPPAGGGESLERATAELSRCDFVGLTERLQESADRLARRLGWTELGPLPVTNRVPGRIPREDVPAETLAALTRLTQLDASLYETATEIYERGGDDGNERELPPAPADATPVSDLRFSEAIQGGGWFSRERVGDEPWFCWIGRSCRAWVDLRAPRESQQRLLIEIPHAIERSILDSLLITLDGARVDHVLEVRENHVAASASVAVRPGADVRVDLEVDRAVRPMDVNPDSTDSRELAIAVRRIAFTQG